MSRTIPKITAIILFAAIAWSCSHEYDPKLLELERIISTQDGVGPKVLNEVDYSELSTENKALYNLLKIKASDLAYIKHENDSLIKVVLDYYSSHKSDSHYPEALYYGGRVYFDINDYPTALKYFQHALDFVPSNTDKKLLRNKVLSQSARLLISLGVMDEAITMLKEATASELTEGDSIRFAHDSRLLGFAYLNSGKYPEADSTLTEVSKYTEQVCPQYLPYVHMYHASSKHGLGELDEAVRLINGIPDKVTFTIDDHNTAEAIAIDIYHAAGLADSAYKYAIRLANSPSDYNKEQAYIALLSPELSHLVPTDSAVKYIQEYSALLQSILRAKNDNAILTQNATYNYSLHDREREKAEARSRRWQWIVCIGAIVLLGAMVAFLAVANRYKAKVIKLSEALDVISRANSGTARNEAAPMAPHNERNLSERLRAELSRLRAENQSREVAGAILSSDVYAKLKKMAYASKSIASDSPLWEELERAVTAASPQLLANVNLLTDGRLKQHDLHTVLLIKAGFTQAEIHRLTDRAASTISARIGRLGSRLMGREASQEEIADFIQAL